MTFGVIIDADHLFALPRYVSDNGVAAILRPTWDDGSGIPWKSSFHHPEGAFVVGYLAVGWRFLIPLLFWGTHVAIDEFQLATLEYSAIVESVFLGVAITGIFVLGYWRWLKLEPDGDLRQYLVHIRERVRSGLSLRPAPSPPSEGTI